MKYFGLLFLLFFYSLTFSQSCNESSLITQQIKTKDTDSDIPLELSKHYTYFNPDCTNRGFLVLHLVGSYDNPSNNTLFPSYAANNGFHSICLKYKNSTAAQTACGSSTDTHCYANFRKEVIEGGDYSSEVDVDETNSIYNRTLKLLQYMHLNNPTEGWSTYYNNETINWSKIIVSGHSQGGGHAAYIAKNNQVARVLMFASPNDYSNHFNAPAPWIGTTHITPTSSYYGFNNLHDGVVDFSDQFEIWADLGMPAEGDSLNIDLTSNYSSSKQLYTTQTGTTGNANHSLMIRDEHTPLNGDNKSIFEPIWAYMLGIHVGLNIKDIQKQEISIYPNPISKTLLISPSFKVKKIEIYDLQGNVVLSIESNNQNIDVSSLNNGLYVLRVIHQDNTISIERFVKND